MLTGRSPKQKVALPSRSDPTRKKTQSDSPKMEFPEGIFGILQLNLNKTNSTVKEKPNDFFTIKLKDSMTKKL